jgi:high affinity Mn2+ porin
MLRRTLPTVVNAIVVLAVSAKGVAASDITPAQSASAASAVPSVFDWSGFYFGGHVAYGAGHGTSTLSDATPASASGSFSSLFGGIQGGYNYVLPSHFFLGLEGDITFPYFQGNGTIFQRTTNLATTVTDEIDTIATARARIGYTLDRWLVYGTGGIAWSQARFGETPGIIDTEDKLTLPRLGWAVGLGAGLAITPEWTARIEYLYDSFGSASGVFPSGTAYRSAFDLQTLRLGLDYKIGAQADKPPANAGDDPWMLSTDNWNVHGQITAVEQGYPAFRSPYEGANSVSGASQAKDTVSATAFIGFRPWDGTDIYFNPEIMQGEGLSDTVGFGAIPNTEAQKAMFPLPRFDVARLYVQQTFGFGGEQEVIPDGPNQIAGKEDISRLTLIAGRLAVTDFFDNNAYAHDGRTQFFNWQLFCCGSYDWTMDQPSYTWGAMAELNQKFWAFRAGYFLEPTVSNGDDFDMRFPHGQYISELELRYSLFSEPGKLRLMDWFSLANMGSYAAALAEPITTPNYPDIALTRTTRTNYGFAANLEQAITNDLGVFARASWQPGLVEIMGWTDCDQSASAGLSLKGTSWGRPDDTIGVAGIIDGLSKEARAYFAAGGLGITIGDGALNYRPETVFETYYSYSLNKWASVSLDYQFVDNPAYNADRGPVHIIGGRFHAQF